MTLSAGTRLGPYEILSPLGAGGMGEVYRARDTRLERAVAVKVLPSHMAGSPETRQRFEREARTISQLSHAHICALYDVGNQDGIEYLVMELLEGETLSDRLAKGALPLEQTLRYGIEIADALDKAHRQGIVHRDLKPGNVMLTKSGVKLLDFGLAKAMAAPAPQSGLTSLPTMMGTANNLTQEGTILGTFQYMAPEQLEGREADGRTDIFAFGCVLYEMATGKKAFSGASQASLISAIMQNDPPPISSVQPMSPPALDRVVRKCLAKDPEDRWQNAADLGSELEWIGEGSAAGIAAPGAVRRRSRERIAWMLAAILAAGLVGVVILHLRGAGPARRGVTRFSVLPPAGEAFFSSLAVSPDGRSLAFSTGRVGGGSDTSSSLWVYSFESGSSRRLAGTEGARYPFWSPDGKQIAFFAVGKLKKVDVSGSPPQIVTEAGDPRGGTWGADGQIVFSPSAVAGLLRVPAGGGKAVPITKLDGMKQESSHRWPLFLPGGKRFVFLVVSGRPDSRGIFLGTLGSSASRRVLPDVSRAEYSPPGYLLFRRQAALMAQRFDPEREVADGEPLIVAETVQADPAITGLAVFSVSASGVLAYKAGANEPTKYVWLDRTGNEVGAVADSDDMAEPSLSPDGKRIAWHRQDPQVGSDDIWLMDLTRNTSSRFTFNPADDVSPIWSPDGTRLVFSSTRKGNSDLYEKPASGGSEERLLLQEDAAAYADDWSLDGKYILYERADPKSYLDLWVLPLSGDRKPFPYLKTPFNETHGHFSPDGRWVAYVSDEAGQPEIFVQPFPTASGGKWQISKGGGDQPSWRRDGKELFFVSLDRKMMSVTLTSGQTLEPGAPKALFAAPVPNLGVSGDRNHYVVTPDGQRFLLRKVMGEKGPSLVTAVLDWTAGLPAK